MTCPGDDALLAFVERTSDGDERSRIEAHLETCSACFDAVAMYVREEPERADGFHARYRIDATIGAGMSGVVYRALDTVLERVVAVKLIDLPSAASNDDVQTALAEAKILAGLNHPNLVTVHDAGVADDRIFIAMELIEGGDLRRWMSETRAASETLAVFVGAARGLEALHGAGLVHRDIKPDNVLVDADGRARLADCGLAGAAKQVSPGIGSPAYWAPELQNGATADARSDQFALCVSLYEALCGERPARAGSIAFPGEVPRRVREAIQRGLSESPDDRYSSVAELRRALESPSSTRARWAWPGLVVAGGIAAVVLAMPSERAPVCERPPEAWDLEARADIRESFAAVDLAWSEAAANRVIDRLDRRADEIARVSDEACAARERRPRLERERLAWCLERQQIALQTDLDVLRSADRDVVRAALTIASGHAAPSECLDPVRLAQGPEPPSLDMREQAFALTRRLAQARIAAVAGDRAEALQEVESVVRHAGAVWPALSFEARALQASVLRQLSSFNASFSVARSTYFAAARAGAWREAARAGGVAALVAGNDFRDVRRGEEWLEHVDVALSRAGEPSRLTAHQLASTRASLSMQGGDPKGAIEILQAELDALHEDEQLTRAVLLGNMAAAWSATGDRAASTEAYRAARDLSLEVRGATHPRTLNAATRLALEYDAWDQPDAAVDALWPWRETIETATGPESVDVSHWLLNVGGFLQRAGELDESADLLEEAAHRYAFAGRLGDEAGAWYTLAYTYFEAGFWFDAHVAAQRAVTRAEAASGPMSAALIGPIDLLATLDRKLGDLDSASQAYDQLVALADAAAPADDELQTLVLLNRGLDHVRRERWPAAIADLEALLPHTHRMPPSSTAKVRLGLAAAYLESEPDPTLRERAEELAEQAWRQFRDLDDEPMAEQALALLDVSPR